MTATVLFVCSANVCRSPFAETIANDRIKSLGAGGLEFGSAGVRAKPGEQRCAVAERWLRGKRVQVDPHESVALTPSLAHSADLVIALDRSIVGSILTLAPTVRGRAFTLLEIEALTGAVRESRQGGHARLSAAVDPLTRYVEELNAVRGFAKMPSASPGRRRFWRRRPSHALDVPDVHQVGGGWTHRQILPLVSAKTVALVDTLLTASSLTT